MKNRTMLKNSALLLALASVSAAAIAAENDPVLEGLCEAGSIEMLPTGKARNCTEDGTWKLSTAPSVNYTVGLIRIDRKLDKALSQEIGEQLSKSKNATVQSIAQKLSGNGAFSVLESSPVFTVEGEPGQFTKITTDLTTIPVQIGHRSEGMSELAGVGFKISVVPDVVDMKKGLVETTIRIEHSIKNQDGSIVTTDVRDKKLMALGEVDILAWEAAGKQYALGTVLNDVNQ